MDEQRFRLRVRYAKRGRLVYLSHLETMRCIERSIRRAGLPYLVTQGFSPHMRLSTGWALPVGVGSRCEYFDLLMGEYIEPSELLRMLSDSMPADLPALDAFYVDPSDKSLEEEFPYSVYRCVLGPALAADDADAGLDAGESGRDFEHIVAEALDALLERGNMVVHRKKKDKVVEFEGLLVGRPSLETVGTAEATPSPVAMTMATFTEGKGSLRPDLFCAEMTALQPGMRVLSITREIQLSEPPALHP